MAKKLFDYVIGNPPYQEETKDTSDKPVYNYFMDAAYEVADKVELVTPARFLFNAGKTPKAWNEKMLNDPHFKVLMYEQNSKRLFPNTDIVGGIAVTYYDSNSMFSPIKLFSHFTELQRIVDKVLPFVVSNGSLMDAMFPQDRFNLDSLYQDFPECKPKISSGGRERRIVSSAFGKLPIFSNEQKSCDDVQILGILNLKRHYLWVSSKYIEPRKELDEWKVFIPSSNGSTLVDNNAVRVIGMPVVGIPRQGITQTFIGLGSYSTEQEAMAALSYVKSKFARALLAVLKVTQNNSIPVWKYVPLQDFTSASDIDWSRSIHEIDLQLYRKYGLDEKEIEFIETHVKEMA